MRMYLAIYVDPARQEQSVQEKQQPRERKSYALSQALAPKASCRRDQGKLFIEKDLFLGTHNCGSCSFCSFKS